jgi:hypothetical protein
LATEACTLSTRLQTVKWFVQQTILNDDDTQTVLAFRLPTGESLCFRCGRSVEAYIEHERKEVIRKANSEPGFRAEFEDAGDILDSDGPNPFRSRRVVNDTECGIEMVHPAAFVKVADLEKALDCLVGKVRSLKIFKFPASMYGQPVEGMVFDLEALGIFA